MRPELDAVHVLLAGYVRLRRRAGRLPAAAPNPHCVLHEGGAARGGLTEVQILDHRAKRGVHVLCGALELRVGRV